ncbi:HNH endonuclease signature motif containing protein [Nocardioides sp. WV_118_6]
MEVQGALPLPGSDELRVLVTDAAKREIYALLYERRDSAPPTMSEITQHMRQLGADHVHTGRRVRELRQWFRVDKVPNGREPRYLLAGWHPEGMDRRERGISGRVRAQVLAPSRCAMCGRTPLEDQVKLVVDHKVPREWGGGDEIENLQPLCEDCNGGKKAWFASYDNYSAEIRTAIEHDDVHRRVGELLKAFRGDWVFTDLIGIVASAGSHQEDYQRRLRELRELGWVIEAQVRHGEAPRARTYYRCVHAEPWPTGPAAREIRRRKQALKAARGSAASLQG